MVQSNSSRAVMAACFVYTLLDVLIMDADDCMISMKGWICVSYLSAVLLKGIHMLGQMYSAAGKNFIFTFRQKSTLAFATVLATWGVLVPFFVAWTVIGTLWFREAVASHPSCFSTGGHPWLVMLWQFLSYAWIFTYGIYFGITCAIEYRTYMAERHMRSVESEDSLSRWGHLPPVVPDLSTYSGATALRMQQGLKPNEILALSTEQIVEGQHSKYQGAHCPICLSDFCPGDEVRALPGCNHSFHRSCVDLWLLRRADCPMCKCKVH